MDDEWLDALASAEPSSSDGENSGLDNSQLTVSSGRDRGSDTTQPTGGAVPPDITDEGYNLRPRVPVYYGN